MNPAASRAPLPHGADVWVCFLWMEDNHRMRYDVVVFSTLLLETALVDELREVAHPARLNSHSDLMGQSLLSRVQAMSAAQQADLFFRCNVSRPEQLDWFTSCCAIKSDCTRLNYGWQAEFRASHVWSHPALDGYKYMLWLDADAYCTEAWKQDPVDVMVRNDLVLLFSNFQGNFKRDYDLLDRFTKHAFNTTACNVSMQGGNLSASAGGRCSANKRTALRLVHGYFHITNLDFFRSPAVSAWTKIMTQENKYSRKWDDQLAVTLPPAMLAPSRAWHMASHGIRLNVFHNGMLGGIKRAVPPGFRLWWQKHGANFSEGHKKCKVSINA